MWIYFYSFMSNYNFVDVDEEAQHYVKAIWQD